MYIVMWINQRNLNFKNVRKWQYNIILYIMEKMKLPFAIQKMLIEKVSNIIKVDIVCNMEQWSWYPPASEHLAPSRDLPMTSPDRHAPLYR